MANVPITWYCSLISPAEHSGEVSRAWTAMVFVKSFSAIKPGIIISVLPSVRLTAWSYFPGKNFLLMKQRATEQNHHFHHRSTYSKRGSEGCHVFGEDKGWNGNRGGIFPYKYIQGKTRGGKTKYVRGRGTCRDSRTPFHRNPFP